MKNKTCCHLISSISYSLLLVCRLNELTNGYVQTNFYPRILYGIKIQIDNPIQIGRQRHHCKQIEENLLNNRYHYSNRVNLNKKTGEN